MKALLRLLISICLSCLSMYPSSAQTTYYSLNYDAYAPASINWGWSHTYSGVVPWQFGQPYTVGIYERFDVPGEDGYNKVAAIVDCGIIDYPNYNVLMKSPFINLTTATHPWLQYDSYFLKYVKANKTEKATVEVSTDSGATWTVVQDVPASPVTAFKTWHIDLTAYAGQFIKLGFRYSDDTGITMKGWAVDNIKVWEPPLKDIALTKALPDNPLTGYVVVGQSIFLSGTVYNAGLDTIHTITINYQEGANPVQSHTVSGITIAPFESYNFTHSIPYTMPDMNSHVLTMSAVLAGDSYATNNSKTITLKGAAFAPEKIPVIEEETGCWNIYAPRGIVYFKQLESSDYPVNLISVHSNDPMDYYDYDHYLYDIGANQFNYQPAMYVDRGIKINPDLTVDTYLGNRSRFGFATMSINIASLSQNNITLNTSVKPAVDLPGNYRLAIVLTEDKLSGSMAPWDQRNGYAGGNRGPMGGFESKPDPVPAADMVYNHVARTIYPDPRGGSGYLPASMVHSTVYNNSFTFPIQPGWIQSNMKAIVMLIKDSDSTILNSASVRFPSLGVPGITGNGPEVRLYPNPSIDKTMLSFQLPHTGEASLIMTDISGRTIYQTIPQVYTAGQEHQLPVRTAHLSPGLYMLTLQTKDGNRTLKLNVLH